MNKYLINIKIGKIKVELVFPSYKSLHGDLGYYYNLGVSLSIGGVSRAELHVGLVFGWFKIIWYK